ncbi:MAG: hypothetical protein Tsb0014_08940 [Pleurocapsa sp.]
MERAINSFVHRWLVQHPVVSWLVQHPVISLVGFLVAAIFFIRLFVAIYKLITNSIDRLWLWILRSPFLLIKTLFGWEFKTKTQTATQITSYEVTTNSEQLTQICDRLNTIQQQQQQILQDIALLKQQTQHIQQKPIELVLPQAEKLSE